MHRAFVDSQALELAKTHQTFELDSETLKRFTKILRLKDGEAIELFDGQGLVVSGRLSQTCLTHLQITQQSESKPKLRLFQAMVSMEKLEEITQHTTELGLSELVLFQAERSQIDFRDKTQAKLERLTRIAQDASRQSGRAFVPKVTHVKSLKQILDQLDPTSIMLVASPEASKKIAQLTLAMSLNLIVSTFIGPEGGFSLDEMQLFRNHGVQEIILAPYVLRTETAGVAALAQIFGVCLCPHSIDCCATPILNAPK